MKLKVLRASAAVFLVGLCAGGYWYWLATRPSETGRIDRQIEKAAHAVERGFIFQLKPMMAEDFGASGRLGRDEVLAQLMKTRMQMTDLRIEIVRTLHEDPELPPEAVSARAIVIVKTTGTDTASGQAFQGIAGQGADVFLLDLTKIDEEWLFQDADHLSQDELNDYIAQGFAP